MAPCQLEDIAASSIDVSNIVTATKTIQPQASFQNVGADTQTFNVTLKTKNYISTKTVTSLPPAAKRQVSFDDWTPTTSGEYTITAYSTLSSDTLPHNDTISRKRTVYDTFPNYGWRIKIPLPTPRWAHGQASYYSPTYDTAALINVAGITDLLEPDSTTSKFDAANNTWSLLHDFPRQRYQGHAFYYKNRIYYIGGYVSYTDASPSVLIYDIASNHWSQGAPMLFHAGDYAAAQYHDSLIYIISGYDYTDGYDNHAVQVYNIPANQWSYATAWPDGGFGGGRAGIIDNKIIVFGGYSQFKGLLKNAYIGIIDSTNPKNITWSQIAEYPIGTLSRFAAGVVPNSADAMVYFTGGDPTGNADTSLGDTWAYDFRAGAWRIGPSKPTPVSNIMDFSPVIFNDTVYLASTGGYNAQTQSVVDVNEWLCLGPVSIVLPLHLLNLHCYFK